MTFLSDPIFSGVLHKLFLRPETKLLKDMVQSIYFTYIAPRIRAGTQTIQKIIW